MGACYEVISAFAGKLHVAVPLKGRWVQTSANRVSLGMCQSFAVGASLIDEVNAVTSKTWSGSCGHRRRP
ncbi:hypothetical protein E143388_06075 [Rhodococcus opacus]|nr:hypothetical protein E143388_06075 [Rhodococcus opacus]